MSTKAVLKGLAALLITSVLGGCITTDIEITLNPDGSGTLEYTRDFDRATEEMREPLRQQFSRPSCTQDLSKETILENYPKPHFKLLAYENDKVTLKTRIVLHFNDINALLIKRDKGDLGLNALDFAVDGDTLVFSVKEKKLDQPWPEKFDETPGRETLTIITAKSGEKVTFSREFTSKTEPADWTGRLRFPRKLFFSGGHRICRTPHLQLFHPYPVIEASDCQISNAQWNLRNVKQWNAFELKLNLSLPDSYSYIRWEKPVAMSGGFLPKQPEQRRVIELKGKGDFDDEIELKLPVPNGPAETLDSLTVRIQAYRASGSKIVSLGPLQPNTEYTVDGLTIKTDELQSNRIGFKATGAADRLKSTLIETRRGNRFHLKKSSWSEAGPEKTIRYWESLPLKGASLCVELYNTVEPCYIDLKTPPLDLTQRAWKSDKKSTEPSENWKQALKAEYPKLFTVPVPAVEKAMFEDKALYKSYFQGLGNEQILPAIVAIVDYMILHNPKNGKMWIQTIARPELRKRTEYLDANRQNITEQLFSIYTHTPEKMICLSTFFSNLNLQEFSHPLAISAIESGNFRFADDDFFLKTLTDTDAELLTDSILKADNWVPQLNLLRTLDSATGASLSFAMQLFNDRSLSVHVRKTALGIALKSEGIDPELSKRVIADPTEHQFCRTEALSSLTKQDPFPAKTFSVCLRDLEISRSAASSLNYRLSSILRSAKTDAALREQWEATLQPLIPVLEDLTEHLKDYEAKDANAALAKIRELEAAETP